MGSELTKGIFRQNPVFVLLLGLCPFLAVTTRAVHALGLGAGVTFVLAGCGLAASLLGQRLPRRARPPVFLLIAATLATAVELAMQAGAPGLRRSLGIFVPLIAVNCLILGWMETFAAANRPSRAVLDGLGMGLGFTLTLLLVAAVREALGAGAITLFAVGSFAGVIRIPGLADNPARVLVLAPGALLLAGFLAGLFAWGQQRRQAGRKAAAPAFAAGAGAPPGRSA